MRLWIFVIILSLILALRIYLDYSGRVDYKAAQDVSLKTTLLKQPQTRANIQYFRVDDILIVTSRFPEFHYADTLEIKGTIEEQSITQKNNLTKRKSLILKNPEIEKVLKETNPVLSLAKHIRQKITFSFNNSLPSPYSDLLMGIVFGIREGIDKNFYEALKSTGTLHVTAASGMNVTIFSGYIFSILTVFLHRKIAIIVALVLLSFYAIISGADPSILRATLMSAVAFSAQALGRQNLSFLSLFLTAFIMLMFSPSLIKDAGFELSFAATIGILSLKVILDKKLDHLFRKIYFIKDDFTTTISAQIATFPILLYWFGTFPIISILANLFILWTIPPLMILGLLAASLSLLSYALAAPFLYFSYPLLLYFEKTALFFSKFDTNIEINNLPITLTIGYYLLILALVKLAGKKKS